MFIIHPSTPHPYTYQKKAKNLNKIFIKLQSRKLLGNAFLMALLVLHLSNEITEKKTDCTYHFYWPLCDPVWWNHEVNILLNIPFLLNSSCFIYLVKPQSKFVRLFFIDLFVLYFDEGIEKKFYCRYFFIGLKTTQKI